MKYITAPFELNAPTTELIEVTDMEHFAKGEHQYMPGMTELKGKVRAYLKCGEEIALDLGGGLYLGKFVVTASWQSWSAIVLNGTPRLIAKEPTEEEKLRRRIEELEAQIVKLEEDKDGAAGDAWERDTYDY